MQVEMIIATETDQAFLWDMLYESLYVEEGQPPFKREIIYEPTLAKYVENWGQDGDLAIIARNGETPIGMISLRYFTEQQKGYGFVSEQLPEVSLAIVSTYRGQGLGRLLLSRLMDEAKLRGVIGLSLSVSKNNVVAVRLYEKAGFSIVTEDQSAFTMVKYMQ